MSSLKAYAKEIEEAINHDDPLIAVVGLHNISNSISRALWQPWAKEEALELADRADREADRIAGENGIDRATALLVLLDSLEGSEG